MIPPKDETRLDRFPIVTLVLLGANVLAFLWQIDLPALGVALASGVDPGRVLDGAAARLQASALRGGAIPYEILTLHDIELRDVVPPPLTILSSMFLHGGIGHLASNMLFLWVFGTNVEDALGRARLVALYLAAGIAAALAQTVAAAVTGGLLVPMIGASGAIAGVLAAHLVLLPRSRVFVRVLPVRASFVIVAWFAIQVSAVALGSMVGVAVFAHIGGFVAGYLLVRVLGRRPAWRARRA